MNDGMSLDIVYVEPLSRLVEQSKNNKIIAK